MGRIMTTKSNYSHYLQLREDRRMHQPKAYAEQQKIIADNHIYKIVLKEPILNKSGKFRSVC